MSRALLDAMEPTWPPLRMWREGAWMLRDGGGGGGRVSAATLEGDYDGAPPAMVMIRDGEEALDEALLSLGYAMPDRVALYRAPVAAIAAAEGAADWPPSAEALAAWKDGGKIGPARIAVMERATLPKAVVALPGGAAYVAVNDGLAVIHALEVAASHRRQGLARRLMGAAAVWSAAQGARDISLVVSTDNAPARGLYDALGMQVVGHYHYRQKP